MNLIKNMLFTKKITLSFLLIIGGLCSSFALSYTLQVNTIARADLAIEKLSIANALGDREIEHLSWREGLYYWMAHANSEEFKIQIDPKKCPLGMWCGTESQKRVEVVVPETVPLFANIDESHNTLHRSAIVIKEFIDNGDLKSAEQYYAQVTIPASATVVRLINEIKSLAIQSAHRDIDSFQGDNKTSGIYNTLIIITVILIAVVLWKWLKNTVAYPMHSLARTTSQIARGDLSLRTNFVYNDELGNLSRAIDDMTTSLASKIQQVEKSAEQAKQSAKKVSIALLEADQHGNTMTEMIQDLQTASNQSRFITDNLKAEANTMVNSVSGASSDANETLNKAKIGSSVTENSLTAIALVEEISLRLRVNMEHLGKKAEAIGMVMSLISDIADQTNLLALNAAIEAARAGDAGRGFAVVADEVRKLAEKTMKATHDVGDSIGAIQSEIIVSVNNMEEAVEAVSKSTSLVTESRSALEDILDLATSNAQNISDISKITGSQSAACENVAEKLDTVIEISNNISDEMIETLGVVNSIANLTHELSSHIERAAASGIQR